MWAKDNYFTDEAAEVLWSVATKDLWFADCHSLVQCPLSIVFLSLWLMWLLDAFGLVINLAICSLQPSLALKRSLVLHCPFLPGFTGFFIAILPTAGLLEIVAESWAPVHDRGRDCGGFCAVEFGIVSGRPVYFFLQWLDMSVYYPQQLHFGDQASTNWSAVAPNCCRLFRYR